MHNFGFKIMDQDLDSINLILDYVLTHKYPLEISLSHAESKAKGLLKQRLANTEIPISAHTPHEYVHAYNLHHKEELLETHIQEAKNLINSEYSVLHLSWFPMTVRKVLQPAFKQHLLDNLERAEALCVKYDYRLYIENSFEILSFYREIFTQITNHNLDHLDFCFDIGHAKVWSQETLDEWLNFMDDLIQEGFNLHIHLHANSGLSDEHLSIMEAQERDLLKPDNFFNPYGYPDAFWVIEERFPMVTKVFEVGPKLAVANMQAVEAFKKSQ
ncbi:hypothetical protein TI05_00630 [Achromatium sp. WMS3]|nr:hypothetical protein TI05_00630 [Achromatium sp. WMS3]